MPPQEPKDKSWQSLALAIGAEATGWIVVPALIGLWLGSTLDQWYATQPLWTLICIGLGFVITVIGLLRLAKRYQ